MRSRAVRVWDIKVNKGMGRRRSYTVRWTVSGRERSKTFATRALADHFRSDLMQAMNAGEAFDTDSGLPASMEEAKQVTSWLAFAQAYVAMKWPGAAAKSRDGLTDALATVTPYLVRDVPGRPDLAGVRRALREFVLPPVFRQLVPPPDVADTVRWLERASLPLSELMKAPVVRGALDLLALKLDGTPAAATTMRRKRSVFYNALQYAVELELLEFNPVDKLRVHTRRSRVVGVVDRRVVVAPDQARELLAAVSYVGRRGRGDRLRAFYACMYFAALRPSEALGLRESDCWLPASEWGRLTLEKTRPQAGKRWTDSGAVHDERGLKHRGVDEARPVPIPPELVAILREHIDRYGVAKDGRLFRSPAGGVVGASTYSRVWEEARGLALTPRQVATPLAGRPYDLRHAALSLWLNAGVPAPEAARRAGHSVEVLLKVYANCVDGQEDVVNDRISAALDSTARKVRS